MNELNPKERERQISTLHQQGLKQKDIAEKLGIPREQVKYYVCKIRKQESKILSDYEEASKSALEDLTSVVLTILGHRDLNEEKTKDLINILETLTRVRSNLIGKFSGVSQEYEEVLRGVFDKVIKQRFPATQSRELEAPLLKASAGRFLGVPVEAILPPTVVPSYPPGITAGSRPIDEKTDH